MAHIMPILKLLITASDEMSQIRQIRVYFIANKCIRFRVKKLSALAFITVEDLITVYEALADTFEEDELELISYFEATWIGGVVGRKQRRTLAKFPAAMWNFVGTPLYWINSYNKRPGGVSSLFHLVSCLSTSIDMGAPEVPPEAAGVNRQHAEPHRTRRNQAAWYQRKSTQC